MMSATAVTFSPTGSYPPTPPNTTNGRSRANSIMSNGSNASRVPSESVQSPSILVNGDAPRRHPPRNVAFVNFATVLTKIQEENPGAFYEASTGVPENTPCVTEAPGSPRSQIGPTTIDLPSIDERLEELPEPAASKFSSPEPSVFGGSVDYHSTVSEPLTMAIRPRPSSEPTPRTLKNNDKDKSSSPLPLSKAVIAADVGIGTREYTDWASDIEADVQRDLARLANLANDDFQRDSSLTAEEHYRRRLLGLLNDTSLKYLFGDIGQPPMPTPTEVPTPAKDAPRFGAMYVNRSEFIELSQRVDVNEQRINGLTDMHNHAVKNVKQLQKKFETKVGETDGKIKSMESEHDTMKQDIALLKKLALKDATTEDDKVKNVKPGAEANEGNSKKV